MRASWLVVLGWLAVGQAAEPWSVDAQVRGRVESRTDRDFDAAAPDELATLLIRSRLGLTWRPTDLWRARLLLQDSRTAGPDGRSAATQAGVEVQEAWLRYSGLAGGRLGLTVGRQPLDYGRQRLVGSFEWSNVARRFDAVKFDWRHGSGQLDGWVATLGGSPSTGAVDGEFWGLYQTWPKLGRGSLETYALWAHDPSAAATNVLTGGLRRTAKPGRWRYEVEVAGQVLDTVAWAVAAEGGLRTGEVDWTLGYAGASGDATPGAGGGRQTTFQNLFPTNHLHYGLMDYQSWRNVHDLFAGARLTHGPTWFEVQYHGFWLNNSRDFWYGAGGGPNRTTGGVAYRDPTGASGSEVGQELDLVWHMQFSPRSNLQLGYGHFWPGAFVRAVNAANGAGSSPSDFFYFQSGFAW